MEQGNCPIAVLSTLLHFLIILLTIPL